MDHRDTILPKLRPSLIRNSLHEERFYRNYRARCTIGMFNYADRTITPDACWFIKSLGAKQVQTFKSIQILPSVSFVDLQCWQYEASRGLVFVVVNMRETFMPTANAARAPRSFLYSHNASRDAQNLFQDRGASWIMAPSNLARWCWSWRRSNCELTWSCRRLQA